MTWRPEWYDNTAGRWRSPFGVASIAKSLIIVTVVVFVVQKICSLTVGTDLSPWFGLSRGHALWVYPFTSYMFLHDVGDPLHIFFNMLAVWFFGRDIEADIGVRRFLALYFGAGLVGGLLHIAAIESLVIGASGGCMGLLGYYGFAYPNRQVILMIFPVRARTLVFIFIGVDLWRTLSADGSRVASFAHLGGAFYGILFWRFRLDPVPPLEDLTRRYRQWRERRDAGQQSRQREELDRLLKKISDQGLPSLTTEERRFLERASRDLRNRR